MSAVIRGREAEASGATSPLIAGGPHSAIVFSGDGVVERARFAAQVRGVAALLPDVPQVVNLCEDRYRFMVAFCAAVLRRQVTLLPPTRTRAAIDAVRVHHPDSYCVGDVDACASGPFGGLPHYLRLPDDLPLADGDMAAIADDTLVAIGFTSGSTGTPVPNRKHWGAFRASAGQNLAALQGLWPGEAQPGVVATVPPQHMYGVELSVLLPLLAAASVHAGRPFFPEDVARALREAPAPRLLVSTPVHLRALCESGVALPALAGIVTATAPLDPQLACAAEERFGCEVREMFGATEVCVIAWRRTAREQAWTLYPRVRLQPQPDGVLVEADYLPAPVVLADLVEMQGDGRFVLRGRRADLIEIAGKRASLGDLTRSLLAIPGVRDGVVLQLDEAAANGVRRIAALAVVEDGLDEAAILGALRDAVDPVFLPRRLRCVDALPRNETGKLPRDALLRLLAGG